MAEGGDLYKYQRVNTLVHNLEVMMMNVVWVLIICFTVAIYGIAFYLNKRRKDELKRENKIIDRDPIFFKREHYFECLISTLREIGEELDKSVLSSEGISFEPDYASEKITFHNNISFGTFGAALRAVGNEEGVYKYRFCVEAWREQGYGISRQDYFGANVLLTVIERAFLRLDPKTKVFDKAMKITYTHKK